MYDAILVPFSTATTTQSPATVPTSALVRLRIKTTLDPEIPRTFCGPADSVPAKGEPSDIVTETAVTTVPESEVSGRAITAGLNVIFVGTGKDGGGGGGALSAPAVVPPGAFWLTVKLVIVVVMYISTPAP